MSQATSRMENFAGKTAVITGAGSGLGLALARALASEGAKLMLADINAKDLAAAEEIVKALGAECSSCVTDVAWKGSVDALAERTSDRFGNVHLLFNNAGVSVSGPLWESTEADWEWLIGVNMMGIVHGIQAFVPAMIEHGEVAHIVNTASVAGLITPPGFSAYTVTKHAAVALSEVLYQDLKARTTQVGVSVLCPAYFPSQIVDSERNRPEKLRNPDEKPDDADNAVEEIIRHAVERGKLSADDVARMTLDGISAGRFYILTHPKIKGSIEKRMQDILLDRSPTNPMARGLTPDAAPAPEIEEPAP